MDGIHDLGGKQGFGPIDVNETETPFHHDWEGREWGMHQASGNPSWTIDWWRHVRELIDPVDYLSRRYFDSWAQTDMAAYIDSGDFTLDELLSGKSAVPIKKSATVMNIQEIHQANADNAVRFDRPTDKPIKFAVGDTIVTKQFTQIHHTRLPAYARGMKGIIHAHHGAHLFPDQGAKGIEEAHHLYTVMFEARDLWLEAANSKDRVYLDLWESYLDRS